MGGSSWPVHDLDRLAAASGDRGQPWTPLSSADPGEGGTLPSHPQAEALAGDPFADLMAAQAAFDRWRSSYNQERPHEALAMATPGSRYVPSPRCYPATLPEIVYGGDDAVRKVQSEGAVHFAGRVARVSKALRGERVAIRPTLTDGVWTIH